MSSKKKKGKKGIIALGIIVFIVIIAVVLLFMFFKTKKDNMEKLSSLYFEGLKETQEVGKTTSDIRYKLGCSHVVNYPVIGNKKIDKEISKIVKRIEDDFSNMYKSNTDFDGIDKIEYYQYVDYETYLAPDNTLSVIFNEADEVGEENVIEEKNFVYNFSLDSGEILKDSYIFVGDYKEKITSYLDNYLNNTKKYKDFLNKDYKDVINNKTDYKYAITNKGLNIYFDKYEICSGNMGLVTISIPYTELNGVMYINTSNTTKKLKPNTGVKQDSKYSDVNKDEYLKGLVNFYKKDSKNSRLIGNINKGEKVKVLQTSNTGWAKITYKDNVGYVSSSFLSEAVVADEGYAEVNETVYAVNSVNVRSEASTNGEKLGVLSVGDSVTRIGKGDNGWSEVVYNDRTAYVFSSYLSTSKPVENTPIVVDPQRGIDPNKPMVALSFDDGPNPISTPRILATLAKYNAVATFFDLGNLMYSHANVVKAEEAGGNEVGSHTYDHANLNKLDINGINSEMSQSEDAFMSVLGQKPSLVRPPYGSANDTVKATVKYPLINWDIDTLDWKSRNKDAILDEFRCTDNYDGKIILMHSIYGTTADAVEVIVPELISKGYQLVTISEMASYKGVALVSGRVYYSF